MDLSTPTEKLYMVGPTYARRLKKLAIETLEDLLYHFPFRYLDYSLISPIRQVQPGETVTIQGKITAFKNEYTSRGKKIQKGMVADQTGAVEVIWFNQPFLVRTFKVGTPVSLSGKVDFWGKKPALISPEYEITKTPPSPLTSRLTSHFSSSLSIHTGRLVPVYHETYGVSSKWIRSRIAPLIEKVVPSIKDFLPPKFKEKYQLIDLQQALKQIHFPENNQETREARKRLAFEELFLLQLAALQRKAKWQKKKPVQKLELDQEQILKFTRQLPFELTKAQKRVLREISHDLTQDKPMNRLLEGDVGSGKTVVAAIAIYIAYLNGLQSALMAPTEILAQQHYQTLGWLLTPFGLNISLLTGARKNSELRTPRPRSACRGGQNSEFDLLIGTHALIYKRASFKKLGLIVIDEQHRFGVEQRGQLVKKGTAPHILTMTATPIPRTIALTLYGDLDLSIIDEIPQGRKEIKTWVVPPQKRKAAYQWIKKQIKDHRSQAFIICPLIEESEHETFQSVRAATSEFDRLKEKVFPRLRLGLLHGRMKNKGKDEVLEKFRQKKLDILVATPVVEVGIDIPNATIMMIEGADRFGLAQLHQLRGRVGRGKKQSYCLLFSEIQARKIVRRLKALEKTNLGVELAELDLKLRGPGEIYGLRQHGFAEFKIASFNDLGLIKKTKNAASEIGSQLKEYPLLQAKLKKDTIKTIEPN